MVLGYLGLDPSQISHSKILDAGTGLGRNARALAQVIHESKGSGSVVSVDLDPECFSLASQRLGELNHLVRFVAADLADLPLSEGSFDLVVSTSTLSAVNSRPLRAVKAQAEFFRVLRPGGLLVIKDEYPMLESSNAQHRVQVNRWRLYRALSDLTGRFHYNEIHPHDLAVTLGLVGFKEVSITDEYGGNLRAAVMKESLESLKEMAREIPGCRLREAFLAEIEELRRLYETEGGEFPPQYVIRAEKPV